MVSGKTPDLTVTRQLNMKEVSQRQVTDSSKSSSGSDDEDPLLDEWDRYTRFTDEVGKYFCEKWKTIVGPFNENYS